MNKRIVNLALIAFAIVLGMSTSSYAQNNRDRDSYWDLDKVVERAVETSTPARENPVNEAFKPDPQGVDKIVETQEINDAVMKDYETRQKEIQDKAQDSILDPPFLEYYDLK